MCLRLNEVIRPDMVAPLRPQPYARAVIQPEPTSGFLLLGNVQPFPAPDPLSTVSANLPSDGLEQRCDPPIAITAILAGQGDDGLRQLILVWAGLGYIALRATGMIQQAASTTFREFVGPSDLGYRLPAPVRAYKFPAATSLRICFSSDKSATSRFKRLFSFSNSFSRRA